MTIPTASNPEKPSSSLSSLPDDVVLKCLSRVPRWYDLNLSCVSKTLRSLVRSPDLHRLRSIVHKKSVYLHYYSEHTKRFHWSTLRRSEKTSDYQLVPVPLPSNVLMVFASSAVAVGSKIYFLGGTLCPWKSVLILDTQSGEFRTGPRMKVAREYNPAVGVVDGRIYVIGGRHEDLQVEVFDPKSQTWEFAGEEKVRSRSRFCVSLEGKVYMVGWEYGKISSYDPREGIRNETTERLSDIMNSV